MAPTAGTAISSKIQLSSGSAIGVSSEPVMSGAGYLRGFSFNGSYISGALGEDATGFRSDFPNLLGGSTLKNFYGFRVGAISGTVSGNKIGLEIGSITGTGTNYSIYTGTAKNYFGGDTQVVGQILAKDGTKTSPSYSFSSDPDTGFFWESSGKVAFSANDTKIFTLPTTAPTTGQILKAGSITATQLEWGDSTEPHVVSDNTGSLALNTAKQQFYTLTGLADATFSYTGTPTYGMVLYVTNSTTNVLTITDATKFVLNGDWNGGYGGNIQFIWDIAIAKWVEVTRNGL
jgi:ribosomal protein L27